MAGRPIDQKIVAMKMDNSDFKKKAAETTGIFGKLRDALNKIPGVDLSRTTKAFGDIQRAAGNTDLSGLSRAADTVASRFSNLGIVATTALMNITNRAVDAGLAMSKQFTTQPLIDGFKEYETKMGSIQTILANTQSRGTTLADVKKSLGELNTYADKTIYSFSDMTKNIGLFTNAGLGLEESTSMIKGFSNAAAASGTNAEDAARAAYQLSQGLSSGYLMQEDWMSLTSAGMGNSNMKKDLISIAQGMGLLSKTTGNSEAVMKNWKTDLTKGKWLTSGVMSTYLQAMAGDMDKATLMTKGLTSAQADLLLQNAKTGNQAATYVRTFTQLFSALKEGIGSGWATTWELIIGDFDVATKRLSALSNVLGGIFQKQADTRNRFIKSLADNGVFETMFSGLTAIGQGISSVFGAISNAFSKVFSPLNVTAVFAFAKGFKDFALSLKPSEATIKNISTIFQAVFSVIKTGVIIIYSLGKALIDMIPPGIVGKIISFIASIAKLVIAFTDSIRSGKDAGSSFSGLEGIFAAIGGVINKLVKGFSILGDAISKAWDTLANGNIGQSLSSINFSLAPVINGFKEFFKVIGDGYNWVKEKISAIGTAIKEHIPTGNQLFAGGFIAGLVAVVMLALKTAHNLFSVFTSWGEIGKGVAKTLESVSGALDSFATTMKANAFTTIAIGVAIAVGLLAGSLFLLSKLNSQDITKGLYGLIGIITALIGAMAIVTKYDITGAGMKSALQMVVMGAAIAIMAGALKKLSGINPGELTKGILGLVSIMGALSGAVILMSKFGGPNVATTSLQFIAIAASIHILISAVQKIAGIDTGALVKGVLTLGVVMTELGLFMKLASGSSFGPGSAIGILAIAGAIQIITSAIKTIGNIDVNVLKQGLVTIALILVAIAAFTQLTSGAGLLATGAGILLLSVALNALIIPIGALGSMNLATLAIGLGAMTIALVAIGAASMLMTGMVAAGAGLILMAAGLTLLIIPISAMAALGWRGLTIGLTGLAASLLIVGGASLLLAPAVVPMLGFGAALALMGIAMLAAGAGMSLFSAGLVALATMTAAAITTIIATIGTFIVGLASLIPTAIDFMVKLVLQMADAIAKNAPKIYAKILEMLLGLLNVIGKNIPKFGDAAAKIIVNFLDTMGRNIPKVIDAMGRYMVNIIDGMANAVRKNGPKLVSSVMNLIGQILLVVVQAQTQMVNALFGWIPGIQSVTGKIGKTAEKYIRDNFLAKEAGNDKGKDFADGLNSKTGNASAAGKNVGKSGKEGANSANLATIGANKGSEFATALGAKAKQASTSGKNLATSGKTGADSVKMNTSGENFGQGFINGIGSKLSGVISAASNLASGAVNTLKKVLDIHSPSKVTTKIGENTGDGYVSGLLSKKKDTEKAASDVGKSAGKHYAKGVRSKQKDAEAAARKVASAAKKGFEDKMSFAEYKFKMDKIDSKEYIAELNNIKKAYSSHADFVREVNLKIKSVQDKSSKERETARNKALTKAKKAYNDAMDFSAYKFKMGKIDSKEYIAEIEKIKKKYKEYPALVRDADLEIKKIRDNAAKQKEKDIKAQAEKDKKAIEEKKFYNKESLTQELADWEAVMAKYKKGTQERIDAEHEVYRVKNEINGKLKSINDDYTSKIKEANQKLIDGEKALNEEYNKAVQDRTNALVGFAGLFDAIKNDSEISGQQLIDNLKGQVDAFATWADNIQQLSKRGVDEGLISELQQMGPKAAPEIAALTTLTDEQLQGYVGLWQTKSKQAKDEALLELEGMKTDTQTKIEELKVQTNIQVTQLKDDWVKAIKELKYGTTSQFVSLKTDMKTVGNNAIKGLMIGLSDKTPELMVQAKSIADSIAATIRSALDIHSPSRVTMKMGEHTGEGLAIGIANKAKQVSDSAKNLALTAKDSLNQFLDGFELPVDNNELHFKAVVDYDGFDPNRLGVKPISVIPDTSFTTNSIAATRAINRQNADSNRSVQTSDKTSGDKSTVITQNLTFNSQQLTPSEVARKNLQASRQLAMQWG